MRPVAVLRDGGHCYNLALREDDAGTHLAASCRDGTVRLVGASAPVCSMTVDDEAEVLRAAWHSDGSVGTASASGILARFNSKGAKSERSSLKCDDQVYGYIPLDAAFGCGPDTAVVAWGSKIGMASPSGPEGPALDTVCDMKDLMGMLEGEEGAPDGEGEGEEVDPMGIDEDGDDAEAEEEKDEEEGEGPEAAEGEGEPFDVAELMNLLCIDNDEEEEGKGEDDALGGGPGLAGSDADEEEEGEGEGGRGAVGTMSVDVFDVALASAADSVMPGTMLALGLSTGGATVIYVSPATAEHGDDAEEGEEGWGLQPLWHHPSAHSGAVMSVCALLGLRGALEEAAGAAGAGGPSGGAAARGQDAEGHETAGRSDKDADEDEDEEAEEEQDEEEEGPAGPIIATGGSDGYVCLWDTQLPCTSPLARLSGISDAGVFALWAPKEGEVAPAACGVDAGPWVLIAVSGNTVVAWDLRPVIGLARAGRGSLSAFEGGPPTKLAPAAWAVLPGSTIHALAVSAEGVFVGGELIVDGSPATVAKVSLSPVKAVASPPIADWLD